jgi:DNA-binding NtrC family response regulator
MCPDSEFSSTQIACGSLPDSVLFGISQVMQELRSRLSRICATTVSVLLQGEVGVGKGVLSRFIHSHSTGVVGPYVRVNCAALSCESADKNPFATSTDGEGTALARVPWGFPMSNIGTLFLDQVHELTPQVQQQLSNSFAECDESSSRDQGNDHSNVRIMCASTRNLRHEVERGRFRRDLFHRLAVVTIDVPPLRNRLEDLPCITEYLRARYSAQFGIADALFPSDLLARMLSYQWPGNIHELESFVCRCVVLGSDHAAFAEPGTATEHGADFGWGDSADLIDRKIKRNWKN